MPQVPLSREGAFGIAPQGRKTRLRLAAAGLTMDTLGAVSIKPAKTGFRAEAQILVPRVRARRSISRNFLPPTESNNYR